MVVRKPAEEKKKIKEATPGLKPASAGVQSLCGWALAKLNRKAEARARFEAALRINPELDSAKKGLASLDPKPAR